MPCRTLTPGQYVQEPTSDGLTTASRIVLSLTLPFVIVFSLKAAFQLAGLW